MKLFKLRCILTLGISIILLSSLVLSSTAEAASTIYQWRGSEGGISASQPKKIAAPGQIIIPSKGTVTIKIDQYSQNSSIAANVKYTLFSVSGKPVGSVSVTQNVGGSTGKPAKSATFTNVLKGNYYILAENNINAGVVSQGDVYFTAN